MRLATLVLHNVRMRPGRSAFTALAVAIAVAAVVTLGVLTKSLEASALGILRTGEADFAVVQKGVSDVTSSAVSAREEGEIARAPGVASAVGVFVTSTKLDAAHPVFLQIGIPPTDLAPFGVTVVAGRPYGAHAKHEIMLGSSIAGTLGLGVGDSLDLGGARYRITGLFRVDNPIGNDAAMLPLSLVQSQENEPGTVTMVFVKATPGADIAALRKQIEHDHPDLATVRTKSDYGRVDPEFALLSAADRGASLLAVIIGALVVMNTTLLSLLERTREFGVLRAIGWSGRRLMALVVGETIVLGFAGAIVGTGVGVLGATSLAHWSVLAGLLRPVFGAAVFARALYVGLGVALLGAASPAVRAARLTPLRAVRDA